MSNFRFSQLSHSRCSGRAAVPRRFPGVLAHRLSSMKRFLQEAQNRTQARTPFCLSFLNSYFRSSDQAAVGCWWTDLGRLGWVRLWGAGEEPAGVLSVRDLSETKTLTIDKLVFYKNCQISDFHSCRIAAAPAAPLFLEGFRGSWHTGCPR